MKSHDSLDLNEDTRGELDNLNGDESDHEVGRLTEDLQQRCELLVKELEEFHSYIQNRKTEHTVELRTFKNDVRNELKLLNRLLVTTSLNRQKATHAIKSSNFPFYDAVWAAAKGSSGIIALRKRFYWDGRQREIRRPLPPKNLGNSVVVDIVSEDGRRWTKVSTTTERKIIYDLAKAGWVHEDSQGESDAEREEDESEGLLRQVECLVKAARANKSKYRWPRINVVLTRIGRECQKPVRDVLNKIRGLGVEVTLRDDILATPPICVLLDKMVVDPFESFSEELNVDCTMLLAFVSDLSHGRVEPKEWHHKFLSRQMEMEIKAQLLPESVWPACGSRQLICTREAATRMTEIVDEIGTVQEKARAKLLLCFGNDTPSSKQQRIEAFQELSQYHVPKAWFIPIKVMDFSLDNIMSKLPPIAKEVAKILSPLNQSVFLYGWAMDGTTISSNRVTVKNIKNVIECNNLNEETVGPDVWLSPTSRSLVGKEKRNLEE